MYLPRTVEKEIPQLCKNFKVLLVTGMRQVGKSTLLQHLSEADRNYVSLDNFDDLDLAEQSPGAFFLQHHLPLFIDEIQRVPKLFRQVKYEVDQRGENGLIWLSGSQRFSLMQGVGDSLAGRIFEIHLMPMSIYERQGKGALQQPYFPSTTLPGHLNECSTEKLWKIIWQGAWPALIDKSTKEREQYFEAFISTFLERDIKTLGNVDKLREFRKFILALALRTGQELRLNKLAEMTGVTELTIRRWLSVAETCGLIYLLPPFFSNTSKTLTKSPKIYFTDTGLAAYLCKFSTPEEMQRDTNAGAFFETFVITEILKSWRHNGQEPDLYYFRDAKKQTEIDLIIHRNGLYYPVEIKMSSHPKIDMAKHSSELSSMGISVGMGAVICTTETPRFLTDNAIAHSIWRI